MRDLIEKKLTTARILLIFVLLSAALFIGSMVLLAFLPISAVAPVIFLSCLLLYVIGLIYLIGYLPFVRSVKWLRQKGLEDVADDINSDKPTLPRSRIFCGQKALFSKKPHVILPYSQIAWVYLYERRSYGIVVEKAVIVFTKDGRKYSLNADAEEFKWMLKLYIIPNAPGVILGYGAEQKHLYKQRNPEAANAGKRAKTIWGIVLMALGAELLVVGLVNNTLLGPPLVMVSGLLAGGCILLTLGKRK